MNAAAINSGDGHSDLYQVSVRYGRLCCASYRRRMALEITHGTNQDPRSPKNHAWRK